MPRWKMWWLGAASTQEGAHPPHFGGLCHQGQPRISHSELCYAPLPSELSGEIRIPTAAIEPLPLDIRKVIARRGAMELRDGMVINLGIGIPSGVGAVANEEGIAHTTLSLESGPIGGVPVAGVGLPLRSILRALCLSARPLTFTTAAV